jgi:antitoxin (DNA-binding transcriptional repressor) of toxin-antitoxin stability system
MSAERSYTATEFKAKCLRILDLLASRKLKRIRITKRGRVVAVLTPPDPAGDAEELFGCLRGTVIIPRGASLLGPALDEPIHAADGRIHE